MKLQILENVTVDSLLLKVRSHSGHISQENEFILLCNYRISEAGAYLLIGPQGNYNW